MRIITLSIALLVSAYAPLAWSSDSVKVGEFSSGKLDGWDKKAFSGQTQYSIVSEGARKVLKATSNQSASGLAKRVKVDLTKTPYLNWSWKINQQLKGLNEQSKQGDDYAARIYVIVDGGLFPWNSKALNYVWSSNQARGANWGNAFLPKNAKMTAVRGKQDPVGVWQTEKRNVRADFKKYYGIDLNSIDGVAVMTDTDNGKGQAVAVYGDVFFSSK